MSSCPSTNCGIYESPVCLPPTEGAGGNPTTGGCGTGSYGPVGVGDPMDIKPRQNLSLSDDCTSKLDCGCGCGGSCSDGCSGENERPEIAHVSNVSKFAKKQTTPDIRETNLGVGKLNLSNGNLTVGITTPSGGPLSPPQCLVYNSRSAGDGIEFGRGWS